MGGKSARNKGASFERWCAAYFREYGYEAKRGIVYAGESDVVGLPYVHLEMKAQEKMRLYDWMEQSKRDAKDGEVPIVVHKQNYKDVLVTMRLEDFMQMYPEWEAGKENGV